MDLEYRTIIEILKSFIHQTVPQIPQDTNWDDVVYLAAINSVLGIVSYMIHKYRLEEEEEILEACKSGYEREYRLNRWKNQKKEELVLAFQKDSIDCIMFKGSVVRELYPIPEFRSFGDIDILIPKKQREKSRTLMKRMGYEESGAWEPVFTYKKSQEYYEFHTELLETDIPQKPECRMFFREPWKHAVLQENNTYRFDEEYHFLYLLTHLAKHMASSGAGIRMFLDLALYVMRFGEQMDWDQIQRNLKEMNLLTFAQTAMTAVRWWFHVESPLTDDSISQVFLEDFTESILLGGTFGREDKDSGMLDVSREDRRSGKANRITIMRKRLFPPASQIAARYTYLQKRPWLLPAAWVHRFVITRGSNKKHVNELRQIFRADVQEARAWNELLRKSGL